MTDSVGFCLFFLCFFWFFAFWTSLPPAVGVFYLHLKHSSFLFGVFAQALALLGLLPLAGWSVACYVVRNSDGFSSWNIVLPQWPRCNLLRLAWMFKHLSHVSTDCSVRSATIANHKIQQAVTSCVLWLHCKLLAVDRQTSDLYSGIRSLFLYICFLVTQT